MNDIIDTVIRPKGFWSTSACCSASEVLRWVGLMDEANAQTDAIVFSMRRVRGERILMREDQPFENLYCVGAGSFKSVQVDVDGYEQVLGFAIHGDMLGLDGLRHGRHASSAIALEDSSVAVLPFRQLMELSHLVPAIEALLLRATGNEAIQRCDIQYLMAARSSEVRVARFLLHFAQRQAALGHSDRSLRLHMTRRDIASFLGLAHETVSRALTSLVACGCITVSQRDIEIIDETTLRSLQQVTRGSTRGFLAQNARVDAA